MAVQTGLRMSFHDVDLVDSELTTDTGMYESYDCEQEKPKVNLSESDSSQQFLELWHKKGELLVYKAFVTRFPDCVLWYDQISGSIPPEVEIQIVTSEMFDSITDSSNNELVCYSTDDKEHLYSSANSNKENFHSDKNNKEHFHVDRYSQEHLQHSDNEDILCRGLQIETPQQEDCEGQLRPHIHCDAPVNVCVVISVDTQLCSDDCISDDCISDDCGSKEEVCCQLSNILPSKLDQNDYCPTELPAPGEVTLKHTISEADVPMGGHLTEAKDFTFQAGNCSDSNVFSDKVVSSASDVSSVADSANQSAVEEEDNPGSESAVQLLQNNEHCYTSRSRSFDDHSYTKRAEWSYSSGHCHDSDDGQDDSEEFGPGELIARLQEAHEDLRHQVFLYVRDIFSEWVRENPGEEFDVSSLDQYLLASETPNLHNYSLHKPGGLNYSSSRPTVLSCHSRNDS